MKERIMRACINDLQVLKALGDNVDTDEGYFAIQAANNFAVQALASSGYNGKWMQVRLNTNSKDEDKKQPITQPHILEQQQALAKACTHGGQF